MSSIKLFDSKQIWSVWNDADNRWYFSVADVVAAPDGRLRKTQCANTEGLLRIIQSVPSPKAEPFKRWLAKVGYERLEEIENPELAAARMREFYKAKGYSDAWIEKRVRGGANSPSSR